MEELRDRLVELEIRYTQQARLIEELNEVLIDACARISRLEQENRTLREQFRQVSADDFTLSPDE